MSESSPRVVGSPEGLDLGLEEADHRRLAAACFNHAWTLLARSDRGPDDDRLLLEVAGASRLHWRHVGGPVESARAAWLLSRVHVVLGDEVSALREAEWCLGQVDDAGLGPFDRAFALEAIARSKHLAGDRQGSADAQAAAHAAAIEIVEDSSREWVRRNLASMDTPPIA